MKGQISSVKGSLLPQFSYYTLAKLIRFFQTFRIAALDMTNLEWSDNFPRSRISLPLIMPFICLGDIVETKVICETTLEGHITGSQRGITISRIGLDQPWSQLNSGSIKRLWCVYIPAVARNKGQEGTKWFKTVGPCNRIFFCDF